MGPLNRNSPNQKTNIDKKRVSPVGINNNEVISNSSSPFENETLARNQEM
jgi:hypothetical protein